MARHTRQNRFSGTGYMRQRSKRGGTKNVLERHVIGASDCWCDHTLCDENGDWEGKTLGAPHPTPQPYIDTAERIIRQGLKQSYEDGEITKEEYDDLRKIDQDDVIDALLRVNKARQEQREKEQQMMTSEIVRLTRGDIPAFTKETQETLMYIVNECGVRWRAIDGGHVLLYPPDGESRPFKVAAARQDKVNRQILHEQFIRDFGLPPMPTSKKEAKAAAAQESAPVPAPRPAEAEVAPAPAPVVEAPQIEPEPVEVEDPETPDLPDDFLGSVRAAIGLLNEALGEQSIEHEALVAMEENDRLRREVDRLKQDKSRLLAERDGLTREADTWKGKAREFETLLDEAVEARDKAQGKLTALRAAFSDD